MKKLLFSISLMVSMAMIGNGLQAQVTPDTLVVPMGNFESWTHYPADSATVLFFSLPVDYEYDLPDGWEIPKYEVNENLSYSGMSIPVHANIPLGIVKKDTVNMPEGHAAVVAQSFLMEDVVTPTVYSLAGAMLDSSLTSTVLPTIVATGTLNIENIISMMDRLLVDMNDMSWLLDLVDSVDINELFTGGFPLNGFEPKRLIGKYKYLAADIDSVRDNGAVVAFGTRYDTVLQRRTLVGAGSKLLYQLSDTVNYEPFTMDYFSLSEYYPADFDVREADTMVVLLISSANEKERRRGSRLFIDELSLLSKNMDCGRIVDLHATEVGITAAGISWGNTATPDRWEVEYGTHGFTQGRGSLSTVTDSVVYFIDLEPDTEYDFYVRGLCGDTAYTDWVFVTIHTDSLPNTQGINIGMSERVLVYPNPANGRIFVEVDGADVESVVLYGIEGRVISEVQVVDQKSELALPSKGVFFVGVKTSEGMIYRKVVNN